MGVKSGGHDLDLAFRVELAQGHLGARSRVVISDNLAGQLADCVIATPEVVTPDAASTRHVDSPHEIRYHLLELGEQHLGGLTAFRQGVGPHPEQQHFIRLAGPVDSDVGTRGSRQQTPQRVECLGADGGSIGRLGIPGFSRVPSAVMLLHRFEPARVGLERPVERFLERPAVGGILDLGRHDVLPAPARPVGVWHVTRRLFQVRHQATAFEHLRQDVGHALARDVCATELRDRVVSVLLEDAAVQTLGSSPAWSGIADARTRLDVIEELVEKEPSSRLGRPRVPREERALDRFRQVGQREDRLVDVAEVRRQRGKLLGSEGLRRRGRRVHAV